jgi:hypothetical protein
MTKIFPKNIVFLDIDGVCNSFGHGSYLTASSEKGYGLNEEIVRSIIGFCNRTESKIVISSNWRRFPVDGTWKFKDIPCRNPLPKLRELLGDLVFDTLTLERHITKSEATILWFEDNPGFSGGFVIFDDDPRENFELTCDKGINRHFIRTNVKTGLTENDFKTAEEILGKGNRK